MRRLLGAGLVAFVALAPRPAYADPQGATVAQMTVHVEDAAVARASALRLAVDWHAVVVADRGSSPQGSRLVLRVPPRALDAAVQSFASLGVLKDQLFTTRDQGPSLNAVAQQLRAQEDLVRFLRTLESRADTKSVAAAAGRALTRAATTAEELRGRLRDLRQSVSGATIDLTLTTGVPVPPHATDESPPSLLGTLLSRLVPLLRFTLF